MKDIAKELKSLELQEDAFGRKGDISKWEM
jgi:hypothetical protein